MKITIKKDLENGVCINSITADDYSCGDTTKMTDFGEPSINLGGTISTGVEASTTGSVDLSSGHDFSVHSEAFIATADGHGPYTVTLTAACANLAAVIDHINTKLASAGLSSYMAAEASGVYVKLATVSAGASHSMILAAGSPSALTIFGMSAATYSGSGDDDFVLSNRYAGIKSGCPFVQKFDSRDAGSVAQAEVQSDMWVTVVDARLKAAIDDMRADVDNFTTESMETY